ncbi:MFS transporter [Paraburkholderia panacisoli]|uniref:MFS transporter n=1 Tax=Paraburkholderia panacisoli TaxID=2603818 RepID=A0A5B0GKS3_9BURK|nr:MFS transporter [Paraburkholderia panacisoli]KAA1004054.1 MFS transporter [Paraburkholderia panacisoli]
MNPPPIDVQQFLDENRFSPYQWLILFLCFLVVAVDGLDTAAMGFIAPSLVTEWDVSKAALAPVMSAALFGLAIGALTAGPLADKHGRKVVIVASVLVFGVASALSAGAWSLWSLTAFRFITGLGLGAAMPNTVTLMTEYAPRRKRALLSTLMFCGFALGSASTGFVASSVIPMFGWRSLLGLGGLLPVTLAAVLMLTLPESVRFLTWRAASSAEIARILRKIAPLPAEETLTFHLSGEAGGHSRSSIRSLFSEGNAAGTWFLWITFFMGLIVVYLLTSWLPTLMKESGVPMPQAAVVTGMFMFGSMFGTILMGWLIDRFSTYVVVSISYGCAAVSIISIGLNPGDVSLLRVLVFTTGFAMGATTTMPIVAAQFYQIHCRATGVSWMLGMGRFGGILGASMGGILMTLGLSFRAIFLGLAIPAILAACAMGLMGVYYYFRKGNEPLSEVFEGGDKVRKALGLQSKVPY